MMTNTQDDPVPQADARERILLAALAEFAARGFDGASTTAIARRSGVTQPLIHYHYRSKEGLWRATVDLLYGRLGKEITEASRRAPSDNPRASLLALVREFVRFCAKYPEFPRLLYIELPIASPRSEWLIERWGRPMVKMILAQYATQSQKLGLAELPVANLVAALTGAAATPFALGNFMRDAWGIDTTSTEAIEAHAEFVVSLIERGIFRDTL